MDSGGEKIRQEARAVPVTEKYFEGDKGAAAAQPVSYQREVFGFTTDNGVYTANKSFSTFIEFSLT